MAEQNPGEPFIRVSVAEAKGKLDSESAVMVDVRNQDEFDEIHATGVLHIPVNNVLTSVGQIRDFSGGKEILFVCKSGQRSALAAEYATAAGLVEVPLMNVEGGTEAWVEAGYPTGD